MSDEHGQQPPPPYPQPASPGMAPPPPPPPPGLFAGQQAPTPGQPAPLPAQPPRKKSWTLLVVGIILGLLVLCAIVSAVIGLGLYSSGSGEKDTITRAEQHFNTALQDVESASASIKGASTGSDAAVKAVLADANKKMRDGRDQIAMAIASAEQLKDSPGRTDYLSSLKQATAAFDAMQDLVAYMDTANGMAAKAQQAAKYTESANSSVNEAITDGNDNNYSAMRSAGVSASTNFTKASVLFREAHGLDPSAGLDKAAAYTDKRQQQAEVIVRMADEGKAGKVSAYNADIKKQAALLKEAQALGQPAIVTDPNWAQNRLADLGNKVDAAAKKADDLRSKALGELGLTK